MRDHTSTADDIWSIGPSIDELLARLDADAAAGLGRDLVFDPPGDTAADAPAIAMPTAANLAPVTLPSMTVDADNAADAGSDRDLVERPRPDPRPDPQDESRPPTLPPRTDRIRAVGSRPSVPRWVWAAAAAIVVAAGAWILLRSAAGEPADAIAPATQPPASVATPTPTSPVQTPLTTAADVAPATAPKPVAVTEPAQDAAASNATLAPITAPPTPNATAPAAESPIGAAEPVPATTVPATTVPVTTVSVTTVPVTTVPVTTVPVAPAVDGPTVSITSQVGPCKYGNACLLAGFTISQFSVRPQEFVCEFGDGSRYTFRFDSGGVSQACATNAADASITIEVGGVRSATVTRP